jgi:hypothetical protein
MASGARWWCDPDPHPDGTVIITHLEPDGRARGRVLTGTELPAPADVVAYQLHEKTCRASKEHARLEYLKQPKCRACNTVMDPWLPANGYAMHINCLPPLDLREAVAAARQAARERRSA